MAEDTTIRPVVIRYMEDTRTSQGALYLRGATFTIPTPEQAWAAHPDAAIVAYADGSPYSDHKAKKEVRERDAVTESDNATVKRSKGSVTRSRTRKGQDTPTVETIVPASPDTSTAMIDGDETDSDGNPVSIEPVQVPDVDNAE